MLTNVTHCLIRFRSSSASPNNNNTLAQKFEISESQHRDSAPHMEGGVGQYASFRDGEVIAESNEVYQMIINSKRLEKFLASFFDRKI